MPTIHRRNSLQTFATSRVATEVARYGQVMRTVGVDLSAEAKGTGIAVIDWDAGGGRLSKVRVGADDAMVLAALNDADRAAIDCPLGWPEPFIDFLIAHRAGRAPAPTGESGLEWRRKLSRRATDLHVAEAVRGCVPLAVGADRIAAVAMRAAGLLAALGDAGKPVDRSGEGLLVEVYPAAALRIWGLASRSYKGTGTGRRWVRSSTSCGQPCPALTGWATTPSVGGRTTRSTLSSARLSLAQPTSG